MVRLRFAPEPALRQLAARPLALRPSMFTRKQPYDQFPPVMKSGDELLAAIQTSDPKHCRWLESFKGSTVVKHAYDFELYFDDKPSEQAISTIYNDEFLAPIYQAYGEDSTFDPFRQVATLAGHGWTWKKKDGLLTRKFKVCDSA
jgi:hypothetical protein